MSLLINPSCPINWDHELMRGLVGRWKVLPGAGNRGGVFRDLVRGGKKPNNATLSGVGIFSGPNGRKGGSGTLNFSSASSQYANIPKAIVTGTPLTLAGWFNTRDVSTGQEIVSIASTSSDTDYFRLTFSNFFGNVLLADHRSGGAEGYIYGTKTISANQWVFGCAVYTSNASRTIYTNGRDAVTDTTSVSGTSVNVTDIGRLGRPTATAYMNGWLDDIMIWNRALLSGEVFDIYKATSSRYDPTLNRKRAKTYSFSSQIVPNVQTTNLSGSLYVKSYTTNDFTPGINRKSIINPSCPINWDHELMQGLVGRWKVLPGAGNRGGTFKDLVIGNRIPHHGTLVNNSLRIGNVGKKSGFGSISFNGSNQYIQCSGDGSLNITGDLTLFAYVYIKTFATDQRGIVFKWTRGIISPEDKAWLLNTEIDSTIRFLVTDSSVGSTFGGYKSSVLTTNTWYHIIASYKSGASPTVNLYINGKLDNATLVGTIPTSINNSDTPIIMGNNLDGGGQWFNGYLDDIGILKTSLNSSEAFNLYKSINLEYDPTLNWVNRKYFLPQSTTTNISSGRMRCVGTPTTTSAIGITRKSGTINPSCPINWDHELMRGLVGRWKVLPGAGNRGGVLRDLVRGGKKPKNGTLTNGPTWSGGYGRPGEYGSLTFNGSNQFVTRSSEGLPTSAPFTVACWFRKRTLGTTCVLGCISKITATSDHFDWLVNAANALYIEIKGPGAATGTATSNTITAGKWHFGAFIYSSSTSRTVFLDMGTGATDTSSNAPTGLDTFAIGVLRRSDGDLVPWDGQIGDYLIWNRALSVSELTAVMVSTQQYQDPTLNWVNRKYFLPQTIINQLSSSLIITNSPTANVIAGGGSGTIKFGDTTGNLEILSLIQAAKIASISSTETLRINGTENIIKIINDSLSGSLRINNTPSTIKMVFPTVSETLQITDTVGAGKVNPGSSSTTLRISDTAAAAKIADARTSGNIRIIDTDTASKVSGARVSPTLFISAAESAGKVNPGQLSGSLHINESGGVVRMASANTSGTVRITETAGAFRARYAQQTGSLLINGTTTNLAKIAAASLIDTLVILNNVTAFKVGQVGNIYTGDTAGSLHINSSLQAILLRPFNVNSTILIDDTVVGQKILKGNSSGSLRITGSEGANKVSYVGANETLRISGSEDARKIAGGNLSGSLRINGIDTASKISGLSALLNLRITDTVTPMKIVFPQLNNFTIRVSETTNQAIKNIYGQVASNLRITGTEAISKDIGIAVSGSLRINSSFNLNAIWNGVLYNIPVRVVSVIDATKISPDRIYILFDAHINRDMLFDLVMSYATADTIMNQDALFDAGLS